MVGETGPRTAFLRDSCFLFPRHPLRALISGGRIYEAGEIHAPSRVALALDTSCASWEKEGEKKNRRSIQESGLKSSYAARAAPIIHEIKIWSKIYFNEVLYVETSLYFLFFTQSIAILSPRNRQSIMTKYVPERLCSRSNSFKQRDK